MSIIRMENSSDYTKISHELLDDTNLSWASKGLLVYLLARPDNEKITIKSLIAQGNLGRDGVRSLLRELREHGYIHAEQIRNAGKIVSVNRTVYESPSMNPHIANQHTNKPDTAETTQTNNEEEQR